MVVPTIETAEPAVAPVFKLLQCAYLTDFPLTTSKPLRTPNPITEYIALDFNDYKQQSSSVLYFEEMLEEE